MAVITAEQINKWPHIANVIPPIQYWAIIRITARIAATITNSLNNFFILFLFLFVLCFIVTILYIFYYKCQAYLMLSLLYIKSFLKNLLLLDFHLLFSKLHCVNLWICPGRSVDRTQSCEDCDPGSTPGQDKLKKAYNTHIGAFLLFSILIICVFLKNNYTLLTFIY